MFQLALNRVTSVLCVVLNIGMTSSCRYFVNSLEYPIVRNEISFAVPMIPAQQQQAYQKCNETTPPLHIPTNPFPVIRIAFTAKTVPLVCPRKAAITDLVIGARRA